MSLQQIKNLKSEKGFTIVELLIVIVVIGILAAIVIVAFNGVQSRAKIAGYQSDSNGIAKVAEGYNARMTAYPLTAANFTDSSNDIKLPSNASVTIVSAAPTITATNGPTVDSTTGAKTYTVWPCANGANVYYYDGTAAKIVKAGAGCP